jgi:hypothetical protein
VGPPERAVDPLPNAVVMLQWISTARARSVRLDCRDIGCDLVIVRSRGHAPRLPGLLLSE